MFLDSSYLKQFNRKRYEVNIFEWDGDRKRLLSALWVFLTVNYIYCDIFILHDAQMLKAFLIGEVGSIKITQEFLLSFSFIMQIPMIMILLSRYLSYKLNRCFNIAAAAISGSIQSYTVSMGGEFYYMFFSFFEIGTALIIIVVASTWKKKSTSEFIIDS